MAWYPQIGWYEMDDDMAQQLELNLNNRWAIWRMEWGGYGVGLKIKAIGPRFEPEVKPKRKAKK